MGLKVGTVKLERFNSNWKKMFLKEKMSLEKVFGKIALQIEHVGSTSIEGICAKPIIDIMVAINRFKDFEPVMDYFSKEPYSIKEDSSTDEILVRKGSEENRTHFIHIVEINSKRYRDTLAFRDYLRSHESAKSEYEKLKIDLANKYANDRKSYTSSKNDFIQKILEEAYQEKAKRFTRRYIISSLDGLELSSPIKYERYYINEHLRVQKRENIYEKETLNSLNCIIEKIQISEEEFNSIKEEAYSKIIRNSYLLLKDSKISIKEYLEDYKGLYRVEVKFDSEYEMNNYEKENWMGKEITDTDLGFDKYLSKLSIREFQKILKRYL